MTKKFTYTEKLNGSTLSAAEWNNLALDVDAAVNAINSGSAGGTGAGSSEYVNLTSKGNIEISSPKNINIEPAGDETNNVWGDISLKPGDDIEFLSEHRPQDKQDEVSLKVHNGNKKPVKLQINAAEFTLTTKDKEGTDANVLDVNINSGKNSKGYLKVRAQAIDLRCEENGGIALQPKGNDGSGHENKIKFEHNGGDGKEFGTFNTDKTSIFTNEYRFNKSGRVYAVTRGALETTYKVDGDPASGVKKIDYPTQSDDFKDILDYDKSCTWELIVNACGNTEDVTAYYIFQLTEELQNPNGPVYPGSVYGGGYVTLDGTAHAITQTPLTVNTQVEGVTSGVSALKIEALETVQTDLAGYINSTKYLPSTEVETFFNLGTGSYNNDVYEFLYGETSSGIKAFLVGNTVYGLVNPADVVDVKLKAPKESASIYIRDVIKLVDYFKNGAGKNDGPWAPVI